MASVLNVYIREDILALRFRSVGLRMGLFKKKKDQIAAADSDPCTHPSLQEHLF